MNHFRNSSTLIHLGLKASKIPNKNNSPSETSKKNIYPIIFNWKHANQMIKTPIWKGKTSRRNFWSNPRPDFQLSQEENFKMINHSSLKICLFRWRQISLTKAIQIFPKVKLTAVGTPNKLKCKKCEVGQDDLPLSTLPNLTMALHKPSYSAFKEQMTCSILFLSTKIAKQFIHHNLTFWQRLTLVAILFSLMDYLLLLDLY